MAVAVATVLLLSAPFLGLLNWTLRRTFPDAFVLIVFSAIGAAVATALAVAVVRIRERRGPRFALIGLAFLLATAYTASTASDNRQSLAVELFHFVQYGVVTFLFYRACRRLHDPGILLVPAFAGFIVGAAEEWFQWFLPARVGELRDLGLNLAAITCALLFSVAVDPPVRFAWTLRPGSSRLVARFAAAAILVLALFVDVIHLGHRIADDEAGLFDSRFSVSRLEELQAERARRWAETPPPLVLSRVSREDQYLTEAMQHAQERNERWAAGDFLGAWNQNRILEKYFAPALDVRWYGARDGLRWPEMQRADADGRAAAQRSTSPGARYVSAAYPYPIFTWPRTLFWACALAAAALVLVAGERTARFTRSRSADSRRPPTGGHRDR